MTAPLYLRERLEAAKAYRGQHPEPQLEALAGILFGEALPAALGPRVLITLDGPCASGKTTLAGELAEALSAAVIHTDDFVVPHAKKTAERLGIPGGNCDWERLCREVVVPWKAGEWPLYRRYDFRWDCLLAPERIEEGRALILEGSYCNLPAIRERADLRLFMVTPPLERMERLRRRESPAAFQLFLDKWIPLENAYFDAYGLPDEGCIKVK